MRPELKEKIQDWFGFAIFVVLFIVIVVLLLGGSYWFLVKVIGG